MKAQNLARRLAVTGNLLLTGSLLLVLVWLPVSVKLFVAAWVLYGVAWLIERAAANRTFELAPPGFPTIPE